jgi:hypothetical protein
MTQFNHWAGADPGFQVRGGALKKIAPSGGRCENFWGISCEKSFLYMPPKIQMKIWVVLNYETKSKRNERNETKYYEMQWNILRSLVLLRLLHNLYFRVWNLYLLVVKIQEVFIIFAFSRKKVRKMNKKNSDRQKKPRRLNARSCIYFYL